MRLQAEVESSCWCTLMNVEALRLQKCPAVQTETVIHCWVCCWPTNCAESSTNYFSQWALFYVAAPLLSANTCGTKASVQQSKYWKQSMLLVILHRDIVGQMSGPQTNVQYPKRAEMICGVPLERVNLYLTLPCVIIASRSGSLITTNVQQASHAWNGSMWTHSS